MNDTLLPSHSPSLFLSVCLSVSLSYTLSLSLSLSLIYNSISRQDRKPRFPLCCYFDSRQSLWSIDRFNNSGIYKRCLSTELAKCWCFCVPCTSFRVNPQWPDLTCYRSKLENRIPKVDLPEIKGNHRKFRNLVTSYIGNFVCLFVHLSVHFCIVVRIVVFFYFSLNSPSFLTFFFCVSLLNKLTSIVYICLYAYTFFSLFLVSIWFVVPSSPLNCSTILFYRRIAVFFSFYRFLPLICVLFYISLFYILTELSIFFLFVSDRVSTNLGAFLFFRKYSLCSKWVFLYWNSSSHRYVELSEYWFFLDNTCIYCLACETNLFLAFVNRRFKMLHTFTCK